MELKDAANKLTYTEARLLKNLNKDLRNEPLKIVERKVPREPKLKNYPDIKSWSEARDRWKRGMY